ncbi:MAG: TetR/AcrR family transcriptional regulator [Galactobacter sp.]
MTDTALMDPRSVRSQDALVRATLHLLAERQADAVSVTDVVHLAEVSRPTLYQHFGDLPTLIVAAVTARLQTLFAASLPNNAVTTAKDDASGSEAIHDLLQHLLDEADVFRHALHGSSGYPVIRQLADLLARRLQERGPLHEALERGATPKHLDRFIGHGAVGIVADWLDVPPADRESVDEVTARLTALLHFQLDHSCATPTTPDAGICTEHIDTEEEA